jgi:ATP-dependent phosphofructokinase / diphosphate-dependent phosphofructokinase
VAINANQTRRRIGILTGGGDCPGLNAVIRGVVKSCHFLGYEVLGFLRGFEGLAEPPDYRILDYNNTAGILAQGGTILGTTNRGRFGVTYGEDQRLRIPQPLIDQVWQTFRQLRLDGLVAIGGDGSLAIAQQLFEHGLPIVGVPKTIDNDLSCTAFSFGFDSAVACAADALQRLHTTAASHDRVMVLEVMGRHAGWIALHGGIAGGADVILIPEIPWTFENVCHKVAYRKRMGRNFTLIMVAEGASLPDGSLVVQQASQGNQQARLGGLGEIVAQQVQQRMGIESRCVVLGHLQRGGVPTSFDRVLATQYGAHAVRLIEEGRFGEMVRYVPPDICGIPMQKAIDQLSKVDPHGSTVVAARALGIAFGDSDGYRNPFKDSIISQPTAGEQLNPEVPDYPE